MIDESEVPQVVAASVLTELSTALTNIGSNVVTAVNSAKFEWQGLNSGFQVSGAEGVPYMLDRPEADARDFSTAMSAGATSLSPHVYAFELNEQTRTDLLARVVDVNSRYETALSVRSSAQTTWNQTKRADPDAVDDPYHRDWLALVNARDAVDDLDDEIRRIRGDISSFATQIESDERNVTTALNNVWGGEDVRGDGGSPVNVSTMSWGVSGPSPYSPMEDHAERFRDTITRRAERRILELAGMDEDAVREWMAAHPDFESVVPLLSPEQGERVWDGVMELTGSTTLDGQPPIYTGAYATLLAAAPVLIGNLNGIPAAERNTFNRANLELLLADPNITGDQREQLLLVRDELRENPNPMTLLNLYRDTDGSPRAALAYGDVERAAQLLTLTHGIETDLGSGADWFGSAAGAYQDVIDELVRNGMSEDEARMSIATIAYLGWDSGDKFTVQHTNLAEGGAAQYTQFVEGLRHRNPDAVVNAWFHSYGTTMAGEAITDRPGLVDNVTFFGSAGLDEDAREAIAAQIADGTIAVDATHASRDWTAWMGRTEQFSEHPVNPLDVPGVNEFTSEYRMVWFGDTDNLRMEWGQQVEGHGAHDHIQPIELWRHQTGYLSTNSTAYLTALERLTSSYRE